MSAFDASDVREALSGCAIAGRWSIARTRSGSSRRTFTAVAGPQRLFVKFDVSIEALRRLSDLSVTPPVVGAGEYRGHSFVVQRHVGGRHPLPRWFHRHLPELGRLIRNYQIDPMLRQLAGSRTAPAHPAYVAAVLVDLENRSGRVLHPRPHSSLARGMNQLRERSATLRPVELVATHGDPNRKNFIVGTDAYLVDWDDLALSDPMRDIGPLLWWYVPPREWKDLPTEIGLDYDDAIRDRLYWWVAAESLDVALRLLEGGNGGAGAADFLDDFVAAINGQGNPHARI